MIQLNVVGLEESLKEPLSLLGRRFEFEIIETGRILKCLETSIDGLKVKVTGENAVIEYKNINTLFRAIGYVIQKLQEGVQEFEIEEKQYFTFNGLMVDCSRNGVLNIAYGKELIERLAIMGHSVMMLYMEDVYELEGEQYFGYMRGRYTKEELQELDQYALKFGIELIPCIQTLAHLEHFLAWDEPKNKYLDIDNILCVGNEEVKRFLDNMLRQLSDTFTSKRIHIGMDEAFNLGRGRYADKHGLESKSTIMNKHLEDILKICNRYGLQPMIWDDMFFNHGSLDDAGNIPKEVDLMYWDYYNNSEAHYTYNLNRRTELDRKVMFAGGAWRWIGYAPHHTKTYVSTNAALMACKKAGVKEVLATAWGDEGSEAPLSTCLFGTVLFAEHGYQETVDLEDFKKRLAFCSGLRYENFMKQEAFDILPEVSDPSATVNPSKYMFYEDPLCSMFVYHTRAIQEDLTSYYQELQNYFEKEADNESNILYKKVDEMYAAFAKVLKLKWNLGVNLLDAYQVQDKIKLKEIISRQVEPLIDVLEVFGEKRFNEWQMTNKSIGYEVLDLRIGGMLQRLRTTKRIVNSYIEGQLDHIVELEEVRLPKTPYRQEGAGEMMQYNEAQKSMTANKMCW